ncbi:MAG: archease [Candidatus Aenigmarchaeota archaeon]|nr:archease [Candidatus Aenigmarchaeota archaeon]
MKYRIIDDLTSDVLFKARGKDMKDVFENAALAMFSVICEVERVKPEKMLEVEVQAESADRLMINWLQELIGLVDTESMFFSKFEVTEIGEKRLKARIYGEDMTPEKGETVVKAVTYYKYKFQKTKEGYSVTVSLDI